MSQELTLRITNIGSRAEGVAFHDGVRYFVPKTLDGDLVRVQPHQKVRGAWVCELLEVIEAGPKRQAAACKHFEDCGGCDLQHLSYSEQLSWKLKTAQHWIRRSPLQAFVDTGKLSIEASPKPLGYRHRSLFHFENGMPGYYKKRSRSHLPIEECPILRPGFLDTVRENSIQEGDAFYLFLEESICEEGSLVYKDKRLNFSKNIFSQPNLFTNSLMQKHLNEFLKKIPGKSALDLFCGMGNFSAVLSEHFDRVLGVESNAEAITYAKQNLPQLEWLESSVDAIDDKAFSGWDLVLLDPSRQGALKSCRQIAKSNIPYLVYVSCQLDSLIRDLTALVKKSDYEIIEWKLFDLLPQTRHIESMVFLRKRTRL